MNINENYQFEKKHGHQYYLIHTSSNKAFTAKYRCKSDMTVSLELRTLTVQLSLYNSGLVLFKDFRFLYL